MRLLSKLALIGMVALSGCAVIQKPIPASQALFTDHESTVAVVMTKMPEPDARMTGAQGILDIAINRSMAKPIVERLQKQDFSTVAGLPKQMTEGLEARHMKAVLVQEPLDVASMSQFTEGSGEGIARLDYRPLAKKYDAQRVLVLSPVWLGTTRAYHGFLPLGAPSGYVAIIGRLVDLKTNKLLWYQPIEGNEFAAGEWDEAPDYPNLMKAVSSSADYAANRLRASFFMEGTTPTVATTAATPQ